MRDVRYRHVVGEIERLEPLGIAVQSSGAEADRWLLRDGSQKRAAEEIALDYSTELARGRAPESGPRRTF